MVVGYYSTNFLRQYSRLLYDMQYKYEYRKFFKSWHKSHPTWISNRGEEIKDAKIEDLIPPREWGWQDTIWKTSPSSEPRGFEEVIYEYRHMPEDGWNGKEAKVWKEKVS